MRDKLKIAFLFIFLVLISILAVKMNSHDHEEVDLEGGHAQVADAELIKIVLPERCSPSPCAPTVTLQERTRAVKKYVHLQKGAGKEVDLRGANLAHMDFSGEDFSGVDFSGADLSAAILKGTDFHAAKLGDCENRQFDIATGEDPLGAKLRNANLEKAMLTGAYLCGADLREANLNDAQLTQEQINAAMGDEVTRLPRNIKRPSYWAGVSKVAEPSVAPAGPLSSEEHPSQSRETRAEWRQQPGTAPPNVAPGLQVEGGVK